MVMNKDLKKSQNMQIYKKTLSIFIFKNFLKKIVIC